MVLVLPPQALDRCIYEEDWVRQEIQHALKCKKNIVPILMRGFVFPPDLPMDIRAVSSMNGVNFETMEFLEARMEKVASLLTARRHAVIKADSAKNKAPSLIRNVCSKGSCDFDNAFPTDGVYSDVINRDHYNIIYFHVDITRIDADQIQSGFRIYDSTTSSQCRS